MRLWIIKFNSTTTTTTTTNTTITTTTLRYSFVFLVILNFNSRNTVRYILIDIKFSCRIIILTSTDHFRGQIHWDDVNFQMTSKTLPYDPAQAYYQSKLANMMHANQLTNRLEGSGVSVFAVHPGRTYLRDHS